MSRGRGEGVHPELPHLDRDLFNLTRSRERNEIEGRGGEGGVGSREVLKRVKKKGFIQDGNGHNRQFRRFCFIVNRETGVQTRRIHMDSHTI